MGCSVFRETESSYIENKYFKEFEASIGFSKHYSSKIDKIFYRYSVSSTIPKKIFSLACKKLSIDETQYHDFFQRFNTHNGYLTQRINLLGIMLGKGTEEQKTRLLFRNYDNDISNTLSKSELEKLATDCFIVSCAIFGSCVMGINYGDLKLKSYVNKIHSCKRFLIKNFVAGILEDKNQVSLDEFKDKILGESFSYIFKPREMRMYCAKLSLEIGMASKTLEDLFKED
jgi:Ca2+-binding EF-hand superfamily protein